MIILFNTRLYLKMINYLKKKIKAHFYFKKVSNSFMNYILNNLNEKYIFLLTLVLLSPLLNSGFFSDDAYQSQIHGVLIERNTNLFLHTYNEIKGWVMQGRIFPLGSFSFTIFYFLYENIFVYKLLNISIISLCCIFFYKNLHLITKNKSLSFFSVIILLSSFQLRLWHDPIQGFHILLPLTTLFFLISIFYLQKYLILNKKLYLKYSFFSFVIMLLHYEVTYSLILIYPLIFFIYKKKLIEVLKTLKNFIYFLTIIISVSFLIRAYNYIFSKSVYTSIDLSNFIGTLKAFLIQVFSSFPLSYLYRTQEKKIFNFIEYYDLVILIFLIFLIFFNLLRARIDKKSFNLFYLFLFGFILLTGPAFVSSVTGHKNEIIAAGIGFGYLPVFIQHFGASIILLIPVIKFLKNKYLNLYIIFTFALFMTSVLYLNLLSNRFVNNEANKTYKYPRDLLSDSLKKGLFQKLNDDTIIIRKMRYPHDWMWFHTTYTKKVFDLCDPDKLFDRRDFCLSKKHYFPELFKNKSNIEDKLLVTKNKNIFTYSYNFDLNGHDIGQVFLGKVEKILFKNEKIIDKILVKEIYVYQQKRDRIFRLYFNDGLDFKKIMEDDQKAPAALLIHSELEKYKFN